MTTNPELEALREKLIQTASEIDWVVEAIEKILMPIGPELDSPKPVQWGPTKRQGLKEFLYGTPTTVRLGDPGVTTMEQLFSDLKARDVHKKDGGPR